MVQPVDLANDFSLARKLQELRSRVGEEVGCSDWESFDQSRVSTYGALTGEDLWIHTDPIRAADSLFGATIVQASFLMARFGSWIQVCNAWLPSPAVPVNYGFDRVRILGPLRVGESVRARVILRRLKEAKVSVRMDLMLELETPGLESPVIVAEWIVMFLLPN
jgi:acyl dehydratase